MTPPAARDDPISTTRRKLSGVAGWLGLRERRAPLGGKVVVVSPHLDDGVFSLGAAISYAARNGVEVTVLTVLAGDTTSTQPAGVWDSRAGFRTAGEAARSRRGEDARACELVGARAVWLPFSDHQYDGARGEADIVDAVLEAVGDAEVVLPGFPLMHEDHRWLRRVLEGALPAERVALYTEQPYAAAWTAGPGLAASGPDRFPPEHAWRRVRAGLSDQLRKLRACQAYGSQLPLLGDRPVAKIFRYEARVGGETVTPLAAAQ
jgi:LmbE family N-acetylglucosaminyl deacetylase